MSVRGRVASKVTHLPHLAGHCDSAEARVPARAPASPRDVRLTLSVLGAHQSMSSNTASGKANVR